MLIITKRKDNYFFLTLLPKISFFMKSKIDLFVITRIKERRMQKNISQRGLAAILDCSPSFIGQVESEKFDVKYSVHQVFLVAQFFECSPAEFFPPIDFDS